MSNPELVVLAERMKAQSAALDHRLEQLGRSIDTALGERNALLSAVGDLLKLIDDIRDNSEGAWPDLDPGCIECTQGVTPNRSNTGPCAYHRASRLRRLFAKAGP